ncbi:cell wall hydrolase [Alteraurantiacibacter palmitatis]|uniref:Cell wall hydrolase n=1 Tax=Alteraurantiacibacter palmitatis TaxID=2054628 RepID=A0ABV7E447_9SPHN
MARFTPRAGAFAAAAFLIALGSGTGLSGAFAQDRMTSLPAPSASALPEPDGSAADTGPDIRQDIRFVSETVVQPLPASDTGMAPVARIDAPSLDALVARIPAEDALSAEMTCLAQAVYFEARGEPLHGQLAVARVVINRAASPRFPDDYCAVVKQPGQFSFVRGGAIPAPNASTLAWSRAKAIARIAHQDLWDSQVGESLFFHASHVRPSWAGRRASVARISRHIFYK